jgi:hypothetical protein
MPSPSTSPIRAVLAGATATNPAVESSHISHAMRDVRLRLSFGFFDLVKHYNRTL